MPPHNTLPPPLPQAEPDLPRLMPAKLESARQHKAEQHHDAEQQQEQQQANGTAGGKDVPLTPARLRASLRGYRTDGVAVLMLLACTAALAAGVGVETRHEWLRGIWLSCLLGPLGCACGAAGAGG